MPVFEYVGLDAAGRAAKGLIEADNAKVARTRLRKQGVYPTDVKEQAKGATRGKGLNVQIDLSRYLQMISPRDISQLTQQLSTLIGASVPMVEALTALVDQTEKAKLRVILSQVKERVNEGVTLADALAEHPRVFDNLFVQMVRAGEKSGALDEVLDRLATYSDSQVKLQGKVISALIYPILMTCVGVLILAGLFMGVIPRIRHMFASMGGEETLPLLSRVVFAFGDLVFGWWFTFPFAGAALAFGIRRYIYTPKGRAQWDLMKMKIPVFGKVNRLIAVSRFCRTLGTLLVSGVPIVASLDIARNIVGNVVLAKAIQQAADNIQEGQSIAQPLKASGQFPPVVTHMIAIGEKTGELERMLNLVADAYDGQVENTLEAMTSVLGPLVILGMGGSVFLVALALLLPMMNLMSLVK